MSTRPRYEALDSLRFLAAAVVVGTHVQQMLPWHGAWPGVVDRLFDARAAVVFFFVLSGFVLHPCWRDEGPSTRGYAAFLVRRWFRIVPLYYVSLLLAFLVVALLPLKSCPWLQHDAAGAVLSHSPHDVRQWLANLLMLDPEMDTTFINPPVWTLVVEMKMALVFPLLSWLVQRLRGVAMIVLLVGTTIVAPWLESHVMAGGSAVAHFLLGAVLAEWRARSPSSRHAMAWLVAGALLYVTPSLPGRLAMYHLNVVALGSAMVMWAVLSSDRLRAMLEPRWLVVCGQASYGVYALHFPVLMALAFVAWQQQWSGLVLLSITAVTTLLLAIALRLLIELPGIRWGKRIAKHFARE
jgi:peptidoglycan/LPS O-acetylase OafA/YrhL